MVMACQMSDDEADWIEKLFGCFCGIFEDTEVSNYEYTQLTNFKKAPRVFQFLVPRVPNLCLQNNPPLPECRATPREWLAALQLFTNEPRNGKDHLIQFQQRPPKKAFGVYFSFQFLISLETARNRHPRFAFFNFWFETKGAGCREMGFLLTDHKKLEAQI